MRQYPIGPYVADFICRKYKLIVEVDGATHGSHAELHNNRRSAFLQTEGYRVIRCWNDDVFNNLDGVLDNILLQLNESRQGALIRPSGTFSYGPSATGEGD